MQNIFFVSDKDSLENIFEEAESRVRDEAAIDVDFQGQIKFSVWVTFAEIYNEQVWKPMRVTFLGNLGTQILSFLTILILQMKY